jgi:hypothetical protein
MKRCFLFIALAWTGALLAETYTVTTTADTGNGTLRQAILQANIHAGPDTIGFDIPETGMSFNSLCWFIEPFSDLPGLTDSGTVLDGSTQAARHGDTNPIGPEIYLFGYQGRTGFSVSTGLLIQSSGNVVRNLIVSCFNETGIVISGPKARFNRIEGNFIGTNFSGMDTLTSTNQTGIIISEGASHNTIGGASAGARNIISGSRGPGIQIQQSDSNVVAGNYVGLDRMGRDVLGNAGDGIVISDAKGNRIGGAQPGERNVITGCGDQAIAISGNKRTRDNTVQGNFLGTDIDGLRTPGNADNGVALSNGASCNLIGGDQPGESNLISGHSAYGVYIFTAGTDSNRVIGNRIGTDVTGNVALPNRYGGVCIYNGPRANQIGPSNVIRFNAFGVFLQFDSTRYNRITQNSISNNFNGGIVLFNNANGVIASPSLLASASGAEGYTVPNGTVEIFSDSSGQGRVYEGTATADGSGHFIWFGNPEGPFVTATVTDAAGNTSAFSNAVSVTAVPDQPSGLPRDSFLSANFPNPFNAATVIRFGISSPSRFRMVVLDNMGREVRTLADGRRPAGEYAVRFDASGLPSGIYVVRMEAEGFTASRKMAVVK